MDLVGRQYGGGAVFFLAICLETHAEGGGELVTRVAGQQDIAAVFVQFEDSDVLGCRGDVSFVDAAGVLGEEGVGRYFRSQVPVLLCSDIPPGGIAAPGKGVFIEFESV